MAKGKGVSEAVRQVAAVEASAGERMKSSRERVAVVDEVAAGEMIRSSSVVSSCTKV